MARVHPGSRLCPHLPLRAGGPRVACCQPWRTAVVRAGARAAAPGTVRGPAVSHGCCSARPPARLCDQPAGVPAQSCTSWSWSCPGSGRQAAVRPSRSPSGKQCPCAGAWPAAMPTLLLRAAPRPACIAGCGGTQPCGGAEPSVPCRALPGEAGRPWLLSDQPPAPWLPGPCAERRQQAGRGARRHGAQGLDSGREDAVCGGGGAARPRLGRRRGARGQPQRARGAEPRAGLLRQAVPGRGARAGRGGQDRRRGLHKVRQAAGPGLRHRAQAWPDGRQARRCAAPVRLAGSCCAWGADARMARVDPGKSPVPEPAPARRRAPWRVRPALADGRGASGRARALRRPARVVGPAGPHDCCSARPPARLCDQPAGAPAQSCASSSRSCPGSRPPRPPRSSARSSASVWRRPCYPCW